MLADILLHSTFPQKEIEKERNVLIDEWHEYHDDPGELVDILARQTLWPEQPLGRDVGGTRKTIRALTRDDLLAYKARHYMPNNIIVCASGDVPHMHMVELIAAKLGNWQSGQLTIYPPARNGQLKPRIRTHRQDCGQVHLRMALRGLSRSHPDFLTLELLSIMLGGLQTSRLFLKVRDDLGLAYSIGSFNRPFADTGFLGFYAIVDPKNVGQVIGIILHELDEIKEDVSQDELEKARQAAKGELLLIQDDMEQTTEFLADQELRTGHLIIILSLLSSPIPSAPTVALAKPYQPSVLATARA